MLAAPARVVAWISSNADVFDQTLAEANERGNRDDERDEVGPATVSVRSAGTGCAAVEEHAGAHK